ncbi:MAG TPA: wax ester/triacylglycerol synthase family O-acyltransferase [Actinomycetes bacterium]|nr:wax ester/triacylglycerol synthase family O-acyltransferase [Actinomycetes bacterium]
MSDRLSPLDLPFLYVEGPGLPMHVGAVAIFETPAEGFAPAQLLDLVSAQLDQLPRYRQRLRPVPGHVAAPVWVDDAQFDLNYHVRHSVLPRPGSVDQLRELVARVHARQLDRARPLWEIYLVEGLAGGRQFALVTKTHEVMVDEEVPDLVQVILSASPSVAGRVEGTGFAATQPVRTGALAPALTAETAEDDLDQGAGEGRAVGEPSDLELLRTALMDLVGHPGRLGDAIRGAVGDLRGTAWRLGQLAGRSIADLAKLGTRLGPRGAPPSPLNVAVGETRRYALVRTELEVYRQIRAVHGGTVNDVVLTVVAGALRAWLLARGEAVTSRTSLRALLPVSVAMTGGSAGLVGAYLIDLPVGEPSPVMRLHQIRYRMHAHNAGDERVAAGVLSTLSGFAPPTLHALGARVANQLSRRIYNLVVTNGPGPQEPRYAAGARLLEAYPVVPLTAGHALSIGATSYCGTIGYGLLADRAAVADLDVLGQCLIEALSELAEAVR